MSVLGVRGLSEARAPARVLALSSSLAVLAYGDELSVYPWAEHDDADDDVGGADDDDDDDRVTATRVMRVRCAWPVRAVIIGEAMGIIVAVGSSSAACYSLSDDGAHVHRVAAWPLALASSSSSSSAAAAAASACCALALDESESLIAVSIDDCVVSVHRVDTGAQYARMVDASSTRGCVACVAFGRGNEFAHMLVAASDERSFALHDLAQHSTVYRSGVQACAPFTAVAWEPHGSRFALGTCAGEVWLVDAREPSRCLVQRRLTIGAGVAAGLQLGAARDERAAQDAESPIVALTFVPSDEGGSEAISRPLLGGTGCFVAVATPSDVVAIAVPSFDVQRVEGIAPSGPAVATALAAMPGILCTLRGAAFARPRAASSALDAPAAITIAAIGSAANAFSAAAAAEAAAASAAPTDGDARVDAGAPAPSVFARQALALPLLEPPPSTVVVDGPRVRGVARPLTSLELQAARRKGILVDQPVTFHRRVKSSGYGAKKPAGGSTRRPRPASRPGGAASAPGGGLAEYPCDSAPPVVLQDKHLACNPVHTGPVLRMCYNADATRLLTCSTDGTARSLRLPVARHAGEGTTYLGHNGAVLCVAASHQNALCATGSADGTARVYRAAVGTEALLTLGGAGSAAEGAHAGTEVRFVSFFQVDRLLVCARGPQLFLYQYELDERRASDVEGPRHASRMWRRRAFSGQSITAGACVNSFYSNVLLLGGSNHSIEVYDVVADASVRRIEAAHARAVHSIALAATNAARGVAPEQCEVFASAGSDSVIRLWDLRVAGGGDGARGCVAELSGHQNRTQPVGVALSPCMRFCATGSEDRSAYLYDLRRGSVLARLTGFRDVVSHVAFSPRFAQLAACSYDGQVRFFSDQ